MPQPSPSPATLPARRVQVLDEPTWTARARQHHERLLPWTEPHRERRGRGQTHPVLDFLFTYYSHPPAQLLRWHPGVGVALGGPAADERLTWPSYTSLPGGVGLDVPAFLARRGDAVRYVADLVRATAGRDGQFGCFGLHEWAMVYRPGPTELRHAQVPLRLGQAGTDAVVEGHRVRCSHVDAHRFFSREGTPRNELRPSRATQRDLEQPGCLHATMDLYKWAYKLAPAVPGELVADCFALAADVRTLDMRASPYDLADLGYPPVAIETTEGKAEYVAAQRGFAERAAPLRDRLLAVCDSLLEGADPVGEGAADLVR